MLFSSDAWPGIASGEITLTFRRWKRPQARAGRRQRSPAGMLMIDSVELVALHDISAEDAVRAGFAGVDELRRYLGGSPEEIVFRVAFHLDAEPDSRSALAASPVAAGEVEALIARLERLDSRSARPWTLQTLRLISEKPATRATELAARIGRQTPGFKTDVRKLKQLGLTISLEVGYKLSPRGRSLLDQVEASNIDASHP